MDKFVKLGQEVHITGGSLREAVNEGVRRADSEGYLRKSVADPLTRVNTGDNTPAIIYFDVVEGDAFEITALPKGFGSENMSRIAMMNPTSGEDDIIRFIVGRHFKYNHIAAFGLSVKNSVFNQRHA